MLKKYFDTSKVSVSFFKILKHCILSFTFLPMATTHGFEV